MVFGVFISLAIFLAAFTNISISQKETNEFKRENGIYQHDTSSFLSNETQTQVYNISNYSMSERQMKIQTVETALIRTCRTVSTLAHAKNCLNWNKASLAWSFVGNIGGIGNFDLLTNGPTTQTFDCKTMDNFARGLFRKSLPLEYFKKMAYDFTNFNDNNSDPCGYVDIVRSN